MQQKSDTIRTMFERCLYFNVNALARRVNAIWDEAFAEFKLSPAHAYLLRLVLEHPGLTQTQVSSELKLEKSTVTRFVSTLEEKKLIRRERQGREALLYPTVSAKKIQHRLNKKSDVLYQTMINTIGKKDLTSLVKELRDTGDSLSY